MNKELIDKINLLIKNEGFPFVVNKISFAPKKSSIDLLENMKEDDCSYICVRTVVYDGVEVCVEYERKCD